MTTWRRRSAGAGSTAGETLARKPTGTSTSLGSYPEEGGPGGSRMFGVLNRQGSGWAQKGGVMRRFLIGGAAVLAAVLIAAPAYAAKKASISVSPSTVPAGGTVHVSGSVPVKGCPASDGATVVGQAGLFPPDGFGPTTKRDANGDLALDYTVPTSTPAGTYNVGLRCGGAHVGV